MGNLKKAVAMRKLLHDEQVMHREKHSSLNVNMTNKTAWHNAAQSGFVFIETAMNAFKFHIRTILDGQQITERPQNIAYIVEYDAAQKGDFLPSIEKDIFAETIAKEIFDSVGFWPGLIVYTLNRRDPFTAEYRFFLIEMQEL